MISRLDSSFRDPAGFVYRRQGTLLRQVNRSYADHYDLCVESGLYERLFADGLLIPHVEITGEEAAPGKYRVIAPEEIAYISYPYEWSFSQLKDAALLTLDVQMAALQYGLSLKDASAYNVQFKDGRPIFIDSLSFERYREGKPWVAYRQFCQHFLAPLTVMAFCDLRLRQLTFRYIDGLPLDLASALLPPSTYLHYSTLAHLHLHARSQRRHQDDGRAGAATRTTHLSKRMLIALLDSLKRAIERLSPKDARTEWGAYYEDTNYTTASMQHKEALLARFAKSHLSGEPVVHDLGANTGRFSQVVASQCKLVIAHDIDEMAVERHYRVSKANGSANVLPLVLDLTNPSPPAGWALRERMSFHERVRGSAAIALALIHHLAITNNVPLSDVARFFSAAFGTLIVEFVPKEDSQVQRLLATREDIFESYNVDGFEREFARYFDIRERAQIEGSERVLYAMKKREDSA